MLDVDCCVDVSVTHQSALTYVASLRQCKLLLDVTALEIAPGISRAIIAELRTGRAYLGSLLSFCNRYAEQQLGRKSDTIPADLWREAEQLWDGSENFEYRMV